LDRFFGNVVLLWADGLARKTVPDRQKVAVSEKDRLFYASMSGIAMFRAAFIRWIKGKRTIRTWVRAIRAALASASNGGTAPHRGRRGIPCQSQSPIVRMLASLMSLADIGLGTV
jgi:hypothetical protein